MLRLWSTFYGPRALRTHLLRQKSKLRPSHSSAFSSRILPAISAVSAGRRKKNDVLEAETYDLAERRKWVVENIANSIADPTKTLFAVIYIQEVKVGDFSFNERYQICTFIWLFAFHF